MEGNVQSMQIIDNEDEKRKYINIFNIYMVKVREKCI